MYGCESWTRKKAECRRIDAFKLCWRRLLRVPWTAKKSNQSILQEISPEYSLEGLMLKLKFQYFGLTHLKIPWCWERLKQEEKGTTVDEMVGCYHQLNGCEFDQAPGDGDGHRSLPCCQPKVHQEFDMTELLDNSNNNMNEWMAIITLLKTHF